MMSRPLVVTRCDDKNSPWRLQAHLAKGPVAWAVDFEDLNRQLREWEHDGILNWVSVEPVGYHRCDAPRCPYTASRLVVRSEPDRWVLQMACEEHERYFFGADAPSEVLSETFGPDMADAVYRLAVRAFAKSDPQSLATILLVTERYPFRPEVIPG